MQTEIGGYFSLELSQTEHQLHSNGVYVNSGRHALELISLIQYRTNKTEI